jgi:hypothetical protein
MRFFPHAGVCMSPLDIVWHVLNLFLPAVGVGLLAPAMAKLVWRRALRGAAFGTLVLWCSSAAAVCLLGGLIVLGRDGRMATYLAMIAACAGALWWAGFGPGRRTVR